MPPGDPGYAKRILFGRRDGHRRWGCAQVPRSSCLSYGCRDGHMTVVEGFTQIPFHSEDLLSVSCVVRTCVTSIVLLWPPLGYLPWSLGVWSRNPSSTTNLLPHLDTSRPTQMSCATDRRRGLAWVPGLSYRRGVFTERP